MKKLNTNLIQIKKAKAEHFNLIFNLNKNLIDTYENIKNIEYEKVLNWVKQDILDNINFHNAIYYQNKLIGFFFWKKQDFGYLLDSLFIFNEFQNLGVATYIINNYLNKADCDVYLYVFKKNKSFNLYKRIGFEIVKEIHDTRYLMIKKYK